MILLLQTSKNEVKKSKYHLNRYMTLSSRGITHYIQGIGEFIEIDEWEREDKLFEKLKCLLFFKEYKVWKNFTVWKKF